MDFELPHYQNAKILLIFDMKLILYPLNALMNKKGGAGNTAETSDKG